MAKNKASTQSEYTFPNRFTPRSYQIPLMNALNHREITKEDGTIERTGARFAVSVLPRRHGKDITAFHIIVREALKKRGTYHYCFPQYSQAKKAIWDAITTEGIKFLEFIPPGLVTQTNQQDLKIELFNGSVVQFIGTENIDSIRGTNPIGVVFSEYAFMSPEVFDVYSPILTMNKGWALFISTPNGRNHFYNLLLKAKDKVAQGDKEWFVQHFSYQDLGILSEDEIKGEKERMPSALFSQEYECKFLDGAYQFFKRIQENIHDEKWTPNKNHVYQVGIDLAKQNDSTVITAIDMTNFVVHFQEEYKQIDYTHQKALIEAYWLRHNEPITYIDETGVGQSVCDDLSKSIPNLQRCYFTEKFRFDLLNNLRILIEQDRIKIPNDPKLIAQLEAFQYIISDKGKTKVGVPDSQHDDHVMSLALAVQNMPDWTLPLYMREKKIHNVNVFNYLD